MNEQKIQGLMANYDRFIEREMATVPQEIYDSTQVESLELSLALHQLFTEELGLSDDQIRAAGAVLAMVYMSSLADAYQCQGTERAHEDFADEDPMTHLITHFAMCVQSYVIAVADMSEVREVRA